MSKGKTAKRYPYDVEISSNIFRSYTQKHVAMEVGSAISLYEKSVCVSKFFSSTATVKKCVRSTFPLKDSTATACCQ